MCYCVDGETGWGTGCPYVPVTVGQVWGQGQEMCLGKALGVGLSPLHTKHFFVCTVGISVVRDRAVGPADSCKGNGLKWGEKNSWRDYLLQGKRVQD